MTTNENNTEKVLKLIISKAWEDTDFRKRLVQNPIDEINKLTGANVILPEGKELIVYDQTDKMKVYLNIPSEPDFEDVELSEDQLEIIAGGGQPVWDQVIDSLFPSIKDFIKL